LISQVFIPDKIERFLFEYEYSTFIECDTNLSASVAKYYNSENSNFVGAKLHKAIEGLINIVETAEKLQKKYYLYGGSLLGN
jgi:hypothetical protein